MQRDQLIQDLSNAAKQIISDNDKLNAAISKACSENLWFTRDTCEKALDYWVNQLSLENLNVFCEPYSVSPQAKNIGVIMAGNIPLVGFHDLLVVLLSGNTAIIKMSSDDKSLMSFVVNSIRSQSDYFEQRIVISDTLPKSLDAVIATGNNNSYRYFEHYFKDIPHVLRKNRKSCAVLLGNETESDLNLLADDVFSYFGLGCRNVSLLLIPQSMDIVKIIDAFESYNELRNHNRFANNYTYHKALLLMNKDAHLDNGFALIRESRDLNAPLACVYYSYYDDPSEVYEYIENNREAIQCVVGKNLKIDTVELGRTQHPNLQDFADNIDTFKFLESL